jgi:hypothetical protein
MIEAKVNEQRDTAIHNAFTYLCMDLLPFVGCRLRGGFWNGSPPGYRPWRWDKFHAGWNAAAYILRYKDVSSQAGFRGEVIKGLPS